MINRAAQFAPFSALNGHNDAIKKTEKAVADSFNEIEEEPMPYGDEYTE
jgi:hypothetical protein